MTTNGNERDPREKRVVDLRSDTVTRPTPAMRAAMAAAEVGDDVYGEDPTVNRLQARSAELFQREAALFVPTGCMGNLLAILGWTQRSNEMICEQRAHVNLYELASMSAVAGVMPRTVPAPSGILTWDRIEPLIREKIYYDSQTALVTLENTHNMHGGTVYPTAVAEDICERAHDAGLRVDLQRCGRAGKECGGNHAQIRFGDVLSVERAGCAGGLNPARRTRVHQAGAHPQKNAWWRNAPGRNSRSSWIDRAGSISQAPRARPRKRATSRERPRRTKGNRTRSSARGDQYRDLRCARNRTHGGTDLRATRRQNGFVLGQR